jgi:hypothetical protein
LWRIVFAFQYIVQTPRPWTIPPAFRPATDEKMKKEFRPVARKANLVVQRLGDELLIYDLTTNKAMCLNGPSAMIWELSNGDRSSNDIAISLGREFKAPVSEEYVEFAFDELSSHGLLEDGTAFVADKVSRRQLIKRIGAASAVAIPVVASLVAPQALHAATCVPNNGSCTASAQCCSNCCKNVSPGANQCKPGGGACLP